MTFHVTLVKKESYRKSYGNSTSAALYTPYYFTDIQGKEHFICNLVTQTNDPYHPDKSQRCEVANHLRNLRKHGYRYLTFHSIKDAPFAFLQWLREQNYTLEIQGELFIFNGQDSVDFHGNVCEYSAAFMYRIYDRELFIKLLRDLKTVKRHHAWKRKPATNK